MDFIFDAFVLVILGMFVYDFFLRIEYGRSKNSEEDI